MTANTSSQYLTVCYGSESFAIENGRNFVVLYALIGRFYIPVVSRNSKGSQGIKLLWLDLQTAMEFPLSSASWG